MNFVYLWRPREIVLGLDRPIFSLNFFLLQRWYFVSADEHERVDICGHSSRRKQQQQQRRPVTDASIGYIASVNYPSHYPPDTDCHCVLTTRRSDAQVGAGEHFAVKVSLIVIKIWNISRPRF